MSLNSQPKIRFTPKMLNQKAKKAQPTQEMLDLGIQNSSDSAFFNLPGDIRKRIYEFAFTTGEVIQLLPLDADLEGAAISEAEEEDTMEIDVDIDEMMMGLEINETSLSNDTKPQTRNPFAAILASRQFYLETHLLPFYHNTIYCTKPGDIATTLRRLSPAQASSIRSLKIQWATALLAVQEYMDLTWASGMDPESVRSALQVLDKLEKVVVDWAGKRRIFLNKKRVEEALNALCGRKIVVSFERGGEEYQEVVQRVGTVQQRKRMERADTAMEWEARAWDA
ncbi:uncharacterized protein J4E78_004399 [Alternaria triticimaculans]|uniref:uncharacterized protein n=1 Tax=Alternaria triticimaculans TaxID=297637 RepID=UPI0020C34FEC|nr:uncharacterized protein J4E78_004399 [Alternaria triticimaculans]KAI4661610.1 hypothetical protein J4E78_004399 [Alternaria triticimaculans]